MFKINIKLNSLEKVPVDDILLVALQTDVFITF